MSVFSQIVRFVGISGIGWLIDVSVFSLLGLWSANLFFNNVISSFCGLTFVFVFATKKVFRSRSVVPLWGKYVLYVAYQCVLIYFVSCLLAQLDVFLGTAAGQYELVHGLKGMTALLAKVLVTPVTMICNFIVMKLVVERL